jgi:hypothetical protein
MNLNWKNFRKHREKTAWTRRPWTSQEERGASERTNIIGTLIFNFYPPEL